MVEERKSRNEWEKSNAYPFIAPTGHMKHVFKSVVVQKAPHVTAALVSVKSMSKNNLSLNLLSSRDAYS